jgi:preprotein translocase subunit SecE
MASVVKDNKSTRPEDEAERDHSDETESRLEKDKPPPPVATGTLQRGDGFFHIYKSGQGYWTRMGTALGALLLAALTANFFYHQMPVWLSSAGVAASKAKTVSVAIIGGLLVIYGLIVFWLMNKASNADFLIATDSEMKKVNWTSRKELMGSTKVVIIFMFLIAFLLFAFDIIFGYLFYFLRVLESKPF